MAEKNNIPDHLSKTSRKLPFMVPENYFEELPSRIQERILEKVYKPVPQRIITFIRPKLALAAVIIGFLVIGYMGLKLLLPGENGKTENITQITEMIDYYLYEYDEELIINAVLELEEEIILPADNGSLDEIYDYLSNDDFDYSVLMNEY